MKPHINIGTIGHIDHGKTSLAAAFADAVAFETPQPLRQPVGFLSCAEWPPGHIYYSDRPNTTTDRHDTREQAEAVCDGLQTHGLGGEKIHFPVRTWVEEVPSATEAKELGLVTPPQEDVTPPQEDVPPPPIRNSYVIDGTQPPPPIWKPRKSMAGLLAMTAMLAGCGMYGMGGGRSSAAERNDPDRPKTPQDLERMAAAQLKRERKAARKAQNNATRRP